MSHLCRLESAPALHVPCASCRLQFLDVASKVTCSERDEAAMRFSRFFLI